MNAPFVFVCGLAVMKGSLQPLSLSLDVNSARYCLGQLEFRIFGFRLWTTSLACKLKISTIF